MGYGGCGGGLWYRWVIVYANGRWYFTRNIFFVWIYSNFEGTRPWREKWWGIMRWRAVTTLVHRFLCVFSTPLRRREAGGCFLLSTFYLYLRGCTRMFSTLFFFHVLLELCFLSLSIICLLHFDTGWLLFFFLLVVVFVTTQLVCLVGCLYFGSEWFLYLLLNFVVVFCAVVCMLVSMHIDCCVILFVPSSLFSYCYKIFFHFNDHVIIAYVFIFASCCIPAWVAPPRLEHAICCVLIWVATLPPRGCYCVFFLCRGPV